MLLLTFRLDERRFALHLERVERVLRAMAITPIADAPRNVPGIINVYGRIIPVFDLRASLGMAEKPLEPDDHLIIAHVAGKPVALPVDSVGSVEECPPELHTQAAVLLPGLTQTEGIVRLGQELVLIENLDTLCAAVTDMPDAKTG